MSEISIYRGNIVFSETEKKLAEYRDSYVVVEDGIVEGIYERVPDRYAGVPVADFGSDVIIPAFSDLHTHAPQYPQRGLKTDALLKEWLDKYTFPLEGRFSDPAFAEAAYDAFVDDLVANGTFHVVTFGTIHEQATGMLIEKLEKKGIYAYVGKVNMDENSPAYLCERTEESLLSTERFLEKYCGGQRAKPILTPRFAPTCSKKLLLGLGKLAKKYNVGTQTHLVESRWEAEEAKRLFPDCGCDTEIYEKAGLFESGLFVGAHFIFPSEEDIRLLSRHGGYAVQCPDATVNVIAGIMPTASLSARGIRIGLGSDVAAGQDVSVYSQVAKSVQLSKIKSFYEPENQVVTFAQAFFMATKQGGSLFGKTGSLAPGYAFDALVIGGLSDPFMPLSPVETVERFCCKGGPNNIRARFLGGKKIG